MERIFVFLLLGMMFFSSCYPKKCTELPTGTTYLFELPASLSPSKDTFHVGDTISFRSVFDDMVYDRTFQEKFHLEDFRFSPRTYIRDLNTQSDLIFISDHFDTVLPAYCELFNYSSGGQSILGEYDYAEEVYTTEYKLIPKKTGLYWFSFGSTIVLDYWPQDFEGKDCNNLRVDLFFEMNDGADNNVDFLLEGENEDYEIIWEKQDRKFHNFGGYCFYVEE